MPETLQASPQAPPQPGLNPAEMPNWGTVFSPDTLRHPEFPVQVARKLGEVALGEQLSIENELTAYGQWPVTEAQKGKIPSWTTPESSYIHPPEMTSLDEDKYVRNRIVNDRAHDAWTSGKIDYNEFNERTANKTPRTYQYPLLKQDGQLFNEAKPVVTGPNVSTGIEDGTFWHASNHLMEPGDRLMPSGEVPDAVHQLNKSERPFTSSSSPSGSSFEAEKDFVMGTPRGEGYLPAAAYGKYVYKVSSPNTKIVPTTNGPEAWAEGGGRIEQRMNPDFATNYKTASARIWSNRDAFQYALPGMKTGMEFVPEDELNKLSRSEFEVKYDRMHNSSKSDVDIIASRRPGPEDIALPGVEQYGKQPYAPDLSLQGPYV